MPCVNDLISLKVGEWANHVTLLCNIAINQPQAAYVALTKSFQQEWLFFQRVTPNYSTTFESIEQQLSSLFLPSLLGHDSSAEESILYSLPARMGGLNISNPVNTAETLYDTSREATSIPVQSIKSLSQFSFYDPLQQVLLSKSNYLTQSRNT